MKESFCLVECASCQQGFPSDSWVCACLLMRSAIFSSYTHTPSIPDAPHWSTQLNWISNRVYNSAERIMFAAFFAELGKRCFVFLCNGLFKNPAFPDFASSSLLGDIIFWLFSRLTEAIHHFHRYFGSWSFPAILCILIFPSCSLNFLSFYSGLRMGIRRTFWDRADVFTVSNKRRSSGFQRNEASRLTHEANNQVQIQKNESHSWWIPGRCTLGMVY